jgi:hypothetical protein
LLWCVLPSHVAAVPFQAGPATIGGSRRNRSRTNKTCLFINKSRPSYMRLCAWRLNAPKEPIRSFCLNTREAVLSQFSALDTTFRSQSNSPPCLLARFCLASPFHSTRVSDLPGSHLARKSNLLLLAEKLAFLPCVTLAVVLHTRFAFVILCLNKTLSTPRSFQ